MVCAPSPNFAPAIKGKQPLGCGRFFIQPIHNILKIDTTMNVKIQLSDEAYKTLVNGNGRLEGSLGLVSPTEGNFKAYRRSASRPGSKYIKLPHGRASVGDNHVRLTLRIALDEADIVPADAIMDESRQASDFVDRVFDAEVI